MVRLLGFLLPWGPLASPTFLRWPRSTAASRVSASERASGRRLPRPSRKSFPRPRPALAPPPPRPSPGASAHVTARCARLRFPPPVATAPAAAAAAAVGLGRVVARLEPEPPRWNRECQTGGIRGPDRGVGPLPGGDQGGWRGPVPAGGDGGACGGWTSTEPGPEAPGDVGTRGRASLDRCRGC